MTGGRKVIRQREDVRPVAEHSVEDAHWQTSAPRHGEVGVVRQGLGPLLKVLTSTLWPWKENPAWGSAVSGTVCRVLTLS